MAETRQPVLRAVLADREAISLSLADPGDAEAAAVGAAVGVDEAVARLVDRFALGLEVFFGLLGPRVARYAQLIASAVVDVRVDLHPIADLGGGMRAHCARVGGAVAAQFERSVEGPGERLGRDAPGHDIHGTGRGRVAIEQRRGSAHHLDAFGEQRIERDRVVLGERGRVEHIGTVLENLHAQAALTTDDGPARDRAEVARRDPGLVSQCLGDRRAASAQQLFTVEGEHRLRGLEHRAAQRRGGDPDLLQGRLQGRPGVGRRLGDRGLSCGQRRCGDR